MIGPPPGGYGAPPPGGYSAPPPQGYGAQGYGPQGYGPGHGPQGYVYNPNVPFVYPVECPAANTALTCALVGIFLAGPILQLVAIGYGISALGTIGSNPGMQGRGKAITAIAVACGVYALYAIAIAVAVLTS